MLQMARDLTDAETSMLHGTTFLARVGVRVIRLPPRSPNLNAFAERFVRSVKSECLSKLIPIGVPMLRRAVHEYMEHYHGERNHQGLGNQLIVPLRHSPSSAERIDRHRPQSKRLIGSGIPASRRLLRACVHPLLVSSLGVDNANCVGSSSEMGGYRRVPSAWHLSARGTFSSKGPVFQAVGTSHCAAIP